MQTIANKDSLPALLFRFLPWPRSARLVPKDSAMKVLQGHGKGLPEGGGAVSTMGPRTRKYT
jgi:hypothetical protein